MIIDSITLVCFSPTKTTKKIVEAIGQGTPLVPDNHIDVTLPMSTTVAYESSSNELVILGSPVYGGRIPEDALSRFKRIKARRTPVVLVVVYGN